VVSTAIVHCGADRYVFERDLRKGISFNTGHGYSAMSGSQAVSNPHLEVLARLDMVAKKVAKHYGMLFK
jgi:hypothetical protein